MATSVAAKRSKRSVIVSMSSNSFTRTIARKQSFPVTRTALITSGLLIGRDRLIRLNAPPPLPGGAIALDDVERAKAELPSVAKDLAEKNGTLVASRFFSDKAEPYVPFHEANA